MMPFYHKFSIFQNFAFSVEDTLTAVLKITTLLVLSEGESEFKGKGCLLLHSTFHQSMSRSEEVIIKSVTLL